MAMFNIFGITGIILLVLSFAFQDLPLYHMGGTLASVYAIFHIWADYKFNHSDAVIGLGIVAMALFAGLPWYSALYLPSAVLAIRDLIIAGYLYLRRATAHEN